MCDGIINLATPVRSEYSRSHRRTVFIYECPKCGAKRRILANSYRGKNAVPGTGGVSCIHAPIEKED